MPILILAQNGTFYAFYAPRVQRQTHIRVHTSSETNFDSVNYPQKMHFERRTTQKLAQTTFRVVTNCARGCGGVFFRVTASRAKQALWLLASRSLCSRLGRFTKKLGKNFQFKEEKQEEERVVVNVLQDLFCNFCQENDLYCHYLSVCIRDVLPKVGNINVYVTI